MGSDAPKEPLCKPSMKEACPRSCSVSCGIHEYPQTILQLTGKFYPQPAHNLVLHAVGQQGHVPSQRNSRMLYLSRPQWAYLDLCQPFGCVSPSRHKCMCGRKVCASRPRRGLWISSALVAFPNMPLILPFPALILSIHMAQGQIHQWWPGTPVACAYSH